MLTTAGGVLPPVDWTNTQPSQFDIASGFYPQEKPRTGLQSHPCLIVRVQVGRSTGRIRCLVVYGSSNLNAGRHEEATDLVIQDQKTVRAVGLYKPTRFYISTARLVPLFWDETGFECWDGFRSPILGRLTPELVLEAQRCLAYREHAQSSENL